MDLYHGNINVETLGIPNIEYIYLLKDKYFGFFKNRIYIINKYNKIEYDLIYSDDDNTKKYISLENNNYILFNEITPNVKSSFFITNLDGSIYYNKNTINIYYQIIKLWDNQRYFGYFSNNSLFIITLNNEIYRKYDLNSINPIWASNFVFYDNNLWVLLLSKINYYTLHSFGNSTYYSKYFTIDFNNINKNNITISITNDNILHILIPTIDLKDTYHISKPINNFTLSVFGDNNFHIEQFDAIQLLLASRAKLLDKKILSSTTLKNNEERLITLENLTYLFKPYVEKLELTKKINLEIKEVPNIYYLKSSNPLDYLRWIISNYNTNTYKSVIFYSESLVSVYNYLHHKKLKFDIDLNIISQNYDNYCLLYNKINLNDSFIYERNFIFFKPITQIFKIYSQNNELDNYQKTKNIILKHDKEKIINIFTQLEIYVKELFWSPFLFYKFDIRYLREHTIEYWNKALLLLENSKDIDFKILLYAIFFII